MYEHAWVAKTPSAVNAFKGSQRDFIGYPDFQVWIYTPDTFKALLSQYVPFAVEVKSFLNCCGFNKL